MTTSTWKPRRQIEGETVSYTEAALAALHAGCDLALLCNRSVGDDPVLDELLARFDDARRSGLWRPNAASEARRQSLLPRARALDWPSLMRSTAYRDAIDMLPRS